MASVSLHDILQPQVILDVVSRIRQGQGRLGRYFGFHNTKYDARTVSLSGPNTVSGPTRYASYRLYNNVRTIAHGRAPGTGPATKPANPLGEVWMSCARFHEKLPLDYESLGNLSPVMGPNSQVDNMGQDYISRQTLSLTQEFNNAVELMTAGMCRGQFYLAMNGDNLYPMLTVPSVPYITCNFQLPAGNLQQLNMLGTGNLLTVGWQNPNAPIIGDLANIKAAYAALTGFPLTDIWINSPTWVNVITNNQVRQTAGTSETPFAEFDREKEMGMDGEPLNEYSMRLKGDPTIKWHALDDVLISNCDIDPSYVTAPANPTAVTEYEVPNGYAIMHTTPNSMWCKMYQGGEPVVENPGMPAVRREGFYAWHEYVTQPARIELIGLLNAVPMLYNPNVLCFPQVVF